MRARWRQVLLAQGVPEEVLPQQGETKLALTNAQKQKAYRDRKKIENLSPYVVWLPKDDEEARQKVRLYVERMLKKRK